MENVPHLGAEGDVLGSQLLNLLTELVLGKLHARQLVYFGFPEEDPDAFETTSIQGEDDALEAMS